MTQTAVTILGLTGVVFVLAVLAATKRLSDSGHQTDVQVGILFAVQSVAGYLLAFAIATLGFAVALRM